MIRFGGNWNLGYLSGINTYLPDIGCYHFATIMAKNMIKNHQPKNNENIAIALQIRYKRKY